MRAHGLGGKGINSVFKATTLAKLTYASPAWWGFANSCDKERLEAFLRKAIKAKFYSEDQLSFAELCDKADQVFFKAIISNPNHVLYSLLPPKHSHGKNLRKRTHPFILPKKDLKLEESNFLCRLLYKGAY